MTARLVSISRGVCRFEDGGALMLPGWIGLRRVWTIGRKNGWWRLRYRDEVLDCFCAGSYCCESRASIEAYIAKMEQFRSRHLMSATGASA